MIPRSLVAVLVVAVLGGVTRADEKRDAEAAMTQANEHLQRREYDAAIQRFQEAMALSPKASGPYFGIGIAYAATGRCDRAIDALEEYLRRRVKDPRPEARAELDACRARLNAPGRLRVQSVPGGAE